MGQQAIDNNWIAYVISGLALLLGILNFFWDRLRKSKLIVFTPRYYDTTESATDNDQLDLLLVLTIKADGPKPLLIQDLQLIPLYGQNPLKFKYVKNEFIGGEVTNNFTIPINAGEQIQLICGFSGKIHDIKDVINEKYELQARIDNGKKWKERLCQFSLTECEKIVSPPTWLFS